MTSDFKSLEEWGDKSKTEEEIQSADEAIKSDIYKLKVEAEEAEKRLHEVAEEALSEALEAFDEEGNPVAEEVPEDPEAGAEASRQAVSATIEAAEDSVKEDREYSDEEILQEVMSAVKAVLKKHDKDYQYDVTLYPKLGSTPFATTKRPNPEDETRITQHPKRKNYSRQMINRLRERDMSYNKTCSACARRVPLAEIGHGRADKCDSCLKAAL